MLLKKIIYFFAREISEFLVNNLKLEAHPKKQFIRSVSSSIDFVGYIVRAEYVLVRRRIIANYREKLNSNIDKQKRGKIISSYLAHLRWANTTSLIKRVNQNMQS